MAAISSNTLFHFTKDLDTLKSILTDQAFWPIYCVEYDKGQFDGYYYAIPMVCFCDIPLSQISEHIRDYGSFGLGLSKSWAKEKVSPITYYNDKEALSIKIYNDIMKSELKGSKTPIQYFSLLKRYYGKTWSNGRGRYVNKVLYNEREWRYIPRSLKTKDTLRKITDPMAFSGKNNSLHLKKYSLAFPVSEIKYLFVDTEDNREHLIDFIEETFPKEDSKILISKILAKKQLTEDF